jgi:threonine dehydrogenase-like Zn-dependent dehydrogenase
MGLPGFRCESMPLPDVLIFSCRPGLEAAFTALEEVFGVAAAVDMDVESECAEFRCAVVGEGAIGGVEGAPTLR